MTPKEKASSLYNYFDAIIEESITATDGGGWENCSIHGIEFAAKKCALRDVEHILLSFESFMDSRRNFRNELEIDAERYWLEVKEEIEKL